MCGIAGIVAARDAGAPPRDRVERVLGCLRHRGPDGSGVHADGPAVLGHTRLSVIDVAGGAQPLPSEDGRVVAICNGEIWNHLELRRELEACGHRFRTHSDTEVLPHGYEEWGDEVLERIRGMYALAIWDGRAGAGYAGHVAARPAPGRLLLARDRMGKKPLYLARDRAGLAFASDARVVALLRGSQPRLDAARVPELLFQRYVTAPRTLLDGVEKLRPGHALAFDGSRVDERVVWRVEPHRETRRLPARELRDMLRESTRERLMSDVPLGVLLSGGVDSTAVLGLMHEAGARDVASFTIGFASRVHDERGLARLAAERYRTRHHEVLVDEAAFVAALPRLSWYRDEPVAEPSEVPLLLLAEEAGRHVKVVLTGDGGDELFGGYPKFRAERLLRLAVPGTAAALRAAVRALDARESHRRLGRAGANLTVADRDLRWASWFRSFSPEELRGLLAPGLAAGADPVRLTAPLRAAVARLEEAGIDEGRRHLLADQLTYLPDNMLLRSDKVLMAASLEGRMPLLDHRIAQRVADVPVRDRAALRQGKALLRAAVADLVPREILHGRKMGFPVPVERFLAGGAASPFARLLLSERALSRGLLRPEAVRALVLGEGAAARDPDRALKVWTLASLELWVRQNIDELRTAPPGGWDEVLDGERAGIAGGARTVVAARAASTSGPAAAAPPPAPPTAVPAPR